MHQKISIHEFFVEGSDNKKSHVLLHIAEPVQEEEKDLGIFFAIADIGQGNTDQITEFQTIIEEMEVAYYDIKNHSHNHFENILQKTNRDHKDILSHDNTDISCIVGIVDEYTISLAYRGKPHANLIYKEQNDYKKTAIIDNEEYGPQLFSAITQGDIHIDDTIYIATPHVENYISNDRVRKMLYNKNSKDIAMHIQKVLSTINADVSFGGILFHVEKAVFEHISSASTQKKYSQGSQASMDNLLMTTRSTEETLSPPLFKNVLNSTKKILPRKKEKTRQNMTRGMIETNMRNNQHEEKNNTSFQKFLVILGTILVYIGKGIAFIALTLFHIITKAFTILFFIITNRDGKRVQIYDSVRSTIYRKYSTFVRMSIMTKILLIALISLAVIFFASISYLKTKEHKEAIQAQYNTYLKQAEEKRDDAEARILYGEDDQALEHIKQAFALLDQITTEKNNTETIQTLREDLEKLRQKVQKITIAHTETIIDLNSQSSDELHMMLMGEQHIFAYGNNKNTLFEINPITKEITTHDYDYIKFIVNTDIPKEKDYIAFLTDKSESFAYIPKTQSFNLSDISYPKPDTTITDIAIYNRRLYSLSAHDDMIYKHDPIQTGFGRGNAWIQQKTHSLSNARSLAVDGNIYVLNNDGSIYSFYAGTEEKFEINGLDPVLKNPHKLWTYADINNIYILETTHKRLVVIDKEGNTVGQYTSPDWKNPQDFVISDDETKAYILDDNKIYSFAL